MTERLDAYLARRGIGSRSEVKKGIRAGRAAIDGQTERQARSVVGDEAVVTWDAVVVERGADRVTLMLHKPTGYACSRDEREAPLVEELVPEEYRHLAPQPAGRLDRATSGLLVLSDDGAYCHRLTHPGRGIAKRYRVLYRGVLASDAVARCLAGIVLEGDDRPTRPARLIVEERDADGGGAATLIIQEGRFHQVRRMFGVLGGEVVALHRDRIGALCLPEDLPPGGSVVMDAAMRDAALQPNEGPVATWS